MVPRRPTARGSCAAALMAITLLLGGTACSSASTETNADEQLGSESDVATEELGDDGAESNANAGQDASQDSGDQSSRPDRLPPTSEQQSAEQVYELFRSAKEMESLREAIESFSYLMPRGPYGVESGTLLSLQVRLSEFDTALIEAKFDYEGLSKAEIIDSLRGIPFLGDQETQLPIEQDGEPSYYILTGNTEQSVASNNNPDSIQFAVADTTMAIFYNTTLSEAELEAFKNYYVGWLDQTVPVSDATLKTVSIGFDEFGPDLRYWIEHEREGGLTEGEFTAQADTLRTETTAGGFEIIDESTALGVADDPRIVLYEFDLADTATFTRPRFTVSQPYDDGPLSGWFLGYKPL